MQLFAAYPAFFTNAGYAMKRRVSLFRRFIASHERSAIMKKHTTLIVMLFLVAALYGSAGHAAGISEKKIPDALNNISFGYSEEIFGFVEKPTSRDLEIRSGSFFVGNEDGTKFTYRRSDTEVSQSGPTRWFNIPVHGEEYSFNISSRFSAAPHLTASIEFGRKRVEMEKFRESWFVESVPPGVPWICRPDHPCSDTLKWFPVTSNPLSLSLGYSSDSPWRFSLAWRREHLIYREPHPPQADEKISTLGLNVSYGKRRTEAGFLLERLTPGEAPANTHTELRMAYKFWKGARVTVKAGAFSSGLPLAGNALSDLGSQFVFEYLLDDEKFTPLYTKKIGYMIFGLDYTFQIK
jgi:hypothetical protein